MTSERDRLSSTLSEFKMIQNFASRMLSLDSGCRLKETKLRFIQNIVVLDLYCQI